MGGGREREIRQLQKGKEKARRKGDLKEEAALCNQLGGLLARHGRFQEALQEHRQELHLLESADDVIGCAVAHRKIGECLAELESYEAALKHQRRHLELACSLSSHVEEQRAWATIGRTYMFMAEGEHASEALLEAEKAFRRSLAVLEEKLQGEVPQREVSEMTARLYLNLGLVYDGLKNPAKYTYYIKKSIYISEQAQLHEDLFRAYFNLGNIHLREGEHSQAMRCLERARECARRMSERGLESECCAGIAQVLLSLGDFTAAKRALKKAYRLGSQQPRQRESICRSLRYASKVSSLQQALEEAEASGQRQAALGLCEQLGDLFSKAGDYPRAADAYEKQLSHAQALRRPEPELAVIHVSLAATFGDLKDHARAVEHYRAELALRQGNPLERAKTWLNIALAKEESRESYEELKPCFDSALQCAEQAGDPRLQRQILQHLRASQQRCECPEAADTLARLRELCRAQGWPSDGEAGEDEDKDEDWPDSEPVEASELELSSSDEEADLGGHRTRGPGQRKINKWNQRNDKGETLLHRACIEGNLRQVRFFVEKGHPLNPRDYCGWTPLHEACNHGHLEIVRFLLDHGAAVDDPGGPGCEGITPLHDALNCGHFDVAELLVERGASVLLRNAKGQTPLGTLQAWVQLYGRDLDRETRQRSAAMEQLLRRAMAGRGSRAPQQQSQPFDAELPESPTACPPGPALVPHSPRGSPREPEEGSVSPRKPVRRPWPLAREEESPVGPVGEQGGPAAPAEYRAAMRGVGSAHSRRPPSPGGPARPPGPALIPPEDYVGDDWLEDDLGPRPHARKRGRQSPAGAGAGSAESTASESDEGVSRRPPELTRKRRRRVRQSRLSQTVARASPGRVWGTGAEGRPEAPADAGRLHGASGGGRANGVPEHEEFPPLGPTQLPAPPPPVRVRVRVQDSVFLIPVPHSEGEGHPVSWLAEQASQRYYQSCGLLPRLTLKKEGALLAPQDRVVDVLQSNEEVLAEVQSWDLPPLVERYRKACRNLAVGEHRLLLKALERQEAAPSFSVSGVALRRLHLAPLFRALKLQASVRRLCLAGTGLGDDAAEELLACVGTMPGLAQLDLSANRLGPEGLHKLAEGLSTSAQRLDELDLSLNPLGDRSAPPLAALLRACPVLAVLRLQGCGFTSALLQHGRPLLAGALGGAVQLRSLSVSHNALGAPGLDLLLKSLPGASVTHLEIGSVGARPEDRQPLQEALGRYLAQEDCALSRLSFSGNHLDDAAVAELARGLARCPALVALDLSANRAVGTAGLQALLRALEERGHGLQFLSLAGCGVTGPLDGATWATLSSRIQQLWLCARGVSRGDQRAVAELWQGPAGSTLHAVTRHHKLFCQCR